MKYTVSFFRIASRPHSGAKLCQMGLTEYVLRIVINMRMGTGSLKNFFFKNVVFWPENEQSTFIAIVIICIPVQLFILTSHVARCQTWYMLLISTLGEHNWDESWGFYAGENCSCVGAWVLTAWIFLLVVGISSEAAAFMSHCTKGGGKLSVMAVQYHKPQDHILVQEIGVVCEYRQVSVLLQRKTQYQDIKRCILCTKLRYWFSEENLMCWK